MADAGFITLILALAAAVYSAAAFISGILKKHPGLMTSGKWGLLSVFCLVSLSVVVLLYTLITHDFQLEYVAAYSSSEIPLPYLLSALWAGNDGSLLCWGWLLSLFAVLAVFRKRTEYTDLVPCASSIIMVIEVFFLILLVLVSNPFNKLAIVPTEGMGLNPLLENPGMIFHPPMLLAGYAGFTIPFSFAMAALITSQAGNKWITTIRRWTLAAWLFLGIGNLIGAWWAYIELGWGGYWAWDPVENAGLMPWLTATALLHSITMQSRRGMLKVWNMILVIATFSLVLFGTFLTRSGIVSSIHTFSESTLGIYFLIFICLIIIGSASLLSYRYKKIKGNAEIESLFSKESIFLLSSALLIGSACAIFIGTISPRIFEAVYNVKINLGVTFFNQVTGPIFMTIIFLIAVCTLISWRPKSAKRFIRNFSIPLIASLFLTLALFLAGIREWYALLSYTLCGLVIFSILHQSVRETNAHHKARKQNYLMAFIDTIRHNKLRYSSHIIHMAVILIAVGVTGSSFYSTEQDVILKPGEETTVKSYKLIYKNIDHYETGSKLIVTATLSIYQAGKIVDELTPEKYFYRNYQQPVTEVAIHSSIMEDVYVILAGWDEDGTTAFKILVNPMVNWIWIGGVLLVIGGLIAFWPRRQEQNIVTGDNSNFDRTTTPLGR